MPSASRRFRAMGTDCEVIVYGPSAVALADLAVQRVELLEDCWSRFRPLSELNRLNSLAGGGPVVVSEDLMILVSTMKQAWERTAGRFDPTVLTAIKAAGYDTDFAAVIAREAVSTSMGAPAPTPGMANVLIDASMSTIELPASTGLDPGAIGKGLAADVVVDEIAAAGATGVLVNLGGDVVFAGEADEPWLIEVQDERKEPGSEERVIRWLSFESDAKRGGVATSTTLKRRWGNGRHHVIDPSTGQVASIDLVQATVAADTGWWAEAAATAALLLGPERAPAWLEQQGLASVLLTAHGSPLGTEGSDGMGEVKESRLMGADHG